MTRYYDGVRTGLYRSRDGVLCGVCQGLADYFDLSAFWLRVIVVITFITTGFFPIGLAYIIMALMMKPRPAYARY